MIPRPLLAVLALVLVSGCATQQMSSADTQRQMRVAAAAERGGQLDIALSIYSSAFEANPSDPEVALRYGSILMTVGDPGRARDVAAEARRRNPRDPALLQLEGRALLESGEAASALTLFEEHLRVSPGNPRSLNGRGIALDLLGQHEEARGSYRAAQAADPRNPIWAGNLALSLVLSGCTAEAAQVLDATPRAGSAAAWLGQIMTMARGVPQRAPGSCAAV